VCDTNPYDFDKAGWTEKNPQIVQDLLEAEKRFFASHIFLDEDGNIDFTRYVDPPFAGLWPIYRPTFFTDNPECDDLFCGERYGQGSLDLKVLASETSSDQSSFDIFTATKSNFYREAFSHDWNIPSIDLITPRYGSANDVFELKGSNLGTSLKDYRSVYFGPGRPPQGGNLESTANAALCRADILNAAASNEGEVFGESFHPVMVDDINPAPIEKDTFSCKLADFESGSYNASAFMGTSDLRPSGTFLGGLTDLKPWDPQSILSRDSQGAIFSVQYYPHVTSIEPNTGSMAGGTLVTITGGGFSMDESKNEVTIGNYPCKILSSTIEQIICSTAPEGFVNTTTDAGLLTASLNISATNFTDSGSISNDAITSWDEDILAGLAPESDDVTSVTIDTPVTISEAEGSSIWISFAVTTPTRSGTYDLTLASQEQTEEDCRVVVHHATHTTSLNATLNVPFGPFPYSTTSFIDVHVNCGSDSTVSSLTAVLNTPHDFSMGCTDQKSPSFDSAATTSDGSCTYPPRARSYRPVI